MLAKHIRVPIKPPARIPLSENVCSVTCCVSETAGRFALVSPLPIQLDPATITSFWAADIFERALIVMRDDQMDEAMRQLLGSQIKGRVPG